MELNPKAAEKGNQEAIDLLPWWLGGWEYWVPLKVEVKGKLNQESNCLSTKESTRSIFHFTQQGNCPSPKRGIEVLLLKKVYHSYFDWKTPDSTGKRRNHIPNRGIICMYHLSPQPGKTCYPWNSNRMLI